MVVTSAKLIWCNGSTLAQNARVVGSSPALGTIIPIFITPTTLVAMTMDPIQATCCMVVEPTLSVYMCGHCLYVIVSIIRLTIAGGRV